MSNDLSPENEAEELLTLKWGTLKSWSIKSEIGRALLRRYREIGSSMSAALQRDTPEQKQIICQLIDVCSCEKIYLDWNGEYVTKDKAKEYVMNYGNKK